ncbi:M23 family metallopeptidase [Cypionkella sp.]|uniref:M23 family metallopeptidase n=1 Tax=Cypionkella sp. TaxID=2811411 RepID=UPI00271D8D1A|nr:M23 family metallopeptidase [Cypionkella sp.]MDO8986538.1 M23 family metallopeptidase [Cypionkella sp.]MDP2051496.1 M23 family metallopeptidase [Cypionkella sp.]
MIKALTLSMALAFPAGAFELAFPADCRLGDTCYIQQYVDHDPGPSAQDFTCGPLSYEGHDGTDIALPSRAAMFAGVNVLAAGAGTVKGLRDGIADFAPVVADKECGNGVLVDHGGGWETQYCHMKQGSVRVQVGDAVVPGSVLGQIGQSGMAEFPHLHLSVRHNGAELDPFAPDSLTSCGAPGPGLWGEPLAYQPGGLLSLGISAAIPDYPAVKAGLASPDLPKDAPALVVWAFLFGAQAGDAILFRLTGPDDDVLTERTVLEKTQAQAFRAVGRKLKTAEWPAGRYQGEAILQRRGVELGREQVEITVGQ